MRLLIASDLHGSPDSAAFLLRKAEELAPDACVLLGDFLYHGPRNPLPEGYTPRDVVTMLGQLQQSGLPIMAVRGNCDAEVDQMLLPFPLAESLWIKADALNILASHGHRYGTDPDVSSLAPGTVLLTGHTHVPMAQGYKHVSWWNPGSLTLPKRGMPRSYGLYEEGAFRVLDMEGKVVLHHIPA